jgi:hypothetical protein
MRLLARLAAPVLVAAALAPAPALADRPATEEAPTRPAPREDGRMPWFGLRLGGLEAVGSEGGGGPTAGGGGAYALFDGRDFLADVAADVFVGDRARFFALGLGAYYPFGIGNIAPYAGGGLKVGWTRFGGDGAFGMIPFVAAGVIVGREGYVQLRAEVSWYLAASRETRDDRPGEQGTRAHGPMATLGIAF